MDVIKKFDAAEEREDVNGMCELCTEDILFENPEWGDEEQSRFQDENEEGVCQRHDQVFGR